MIVQTRFLDKGLVAHFTNLPSVTSMNPFVQIQRRFSQKRLRTELTMIIFRRFMFKLMFVHSLEAERLVVTQITFIFLPQHVKIVNMFSQLHFSIKSSFTRVTIESFVDVVLFKLVYRERC